MYVAFWAADAPGLARAAGDGVSPGARPPVHHALTAIDAGQHRRLRLSAGAGGAAYRWGGAGSGTGRGWLGGTGRKGAAAGREGPRATPYTKRSAAVLCHRRSRLQIQA
eukprot:364426-Chlamydomonas_euryale.AAC.9